MTSHNAFVLSQMTREQKNNNLWWFRATPTSRFISNLFISVMAGIMGHGWWIHALAHSLRWPWPLTPRSHIHQVVNGAALDERIQGFLHARVVEVDPSAGGNSRPWRAGRPRHTSARRPQGRPRAHHALWLDSSYFGYASGMRRLEPGGLRAEAGGVTLRLGYRSGAGHWRCATAAVKDAENFSLELLLLAGGGGGRGGCSGQMGGMQGQAGVRGLSWHR